MNVLLAIIESEKTVYQASRTFSVFKAIPKHNAQVIVKLQEALTKSQIVCAMLVTQDQMEERAQVAKLESTRITKEVLHARIAQATAIPLPTATTLSIAHATKATQDPTAALALLVKSEHTKTHKEAPIAHLVPQEPKLLCI